MHEAMAHPLRLLEAVEAEEDVVIARAGKPIARLVPAAVTPARDAAADRRFAD